ncbi:sodium- and chloride-dependent glycine transporter 2-like isoform X2 [Littorina saxatilis]
MELSMAQYAAKGPVRVWDLCPATRGIGLSMCLISVNISLYYNVIMSYILYYFFASFIPELPWTVCKPEWSENCITDRSAIKVEETCKFPNSSAFIPTLKHAPCVCAGDATIDKFYKNCSEPPVHASNLYFAKDVIMESANLSDFGVPSWKLVLLLLLSWILVVACMVKGIQSTGKVVYFTATFPYLVIVTLLIKGATLDGAIDGVKFFIIPDWSLLSNFQLWIDAAGQMFFSLGLSMGGIVMFGSYNKFHHPVYRDAVIISTLDMVTSILSGFVIFTTFGYMAKKSGKGILQVADSSYGLAFVAYPETLSTLAGANFWSFLFFFMLYTLGLDSQFALLETATTYLIDDFVWCRRNKTLLRLIFAVVLFGVGILLCCPGGQYLIGVIDVYASAYPLSVVSLCEAISVMWIYGIERFLSDLEYMLGKKPAILPYWYFVWVFWDPLFLVVLFFATMVKSETPKYADGSEYSTTMLIVCWSLYCLTLSPIIFWFILHARATRRRHEYTTFKAYMKKLLEPGPRCGPADGLHPEVTRRTFSIWADVFDWEVLRDQTQIPIPTDGLTPVEDYVEMKSEVSESSRPPHVPPATEGDTVVSVMSGQSQPMGDGDGSSVDTGSIRKGQAESEVVEQAPVQ